MMSPLEQKQTAQVSILAIGGAGCRVLSRIQPMSSGAVRLLAVDTDRTALELCQIPDSCKLLAAADWRGGRGCGGSVLDGQRAIARERVRIESLISGSEMLIVLGGLGGGTASGGVGVILSVCRKLNIPAVFLLTTPFSLEGYSKRRIADEVLRDELHDLADAVVTLPNDLLFSVLPSTTPLAQAFELADREQAAAAVALSFVLRQGNLLAANFADLAAVLRRRKGFCSIGMGTASAGDAPDGTGRCQAALEKMLKSPLLGGVDKLAQADVVIFSLIGDAGLSIGEVRSVLEKAASFIGKEAKLITGASADPAFDNEIQICALAVKFDVAEEVDAAVASAEVQKVRTRSRKNIVQDSGEVEQLTFALNTMSKGIMDKTTPVIWNGEDLDFPTFQRRLLSFHEKRK